MKQYRRFLLLLAMLPIGTFAKDNFKMTGKIDGVGNDILCKTTRCLYGIDASQIKTPRDALYLFRAR